MFRKLSVFLLTVLAAALLLSSAALAANSGTQENYTWEISDKTLTLTWTGSEPGPMPEDGFPWKNGDSYGSVTSVVIGEGFTSVASQAFDFNEAISSVSLPQTCTTIGKYAFYSCKGLKSLVLPKNCSEIGKSAFNTCNSLATVEFPENIDLKIGDDAFNSCAKLKSVKISAGSQLTLGSEAFMSCKALESVEITGGTCDIEYNAFRLGSSLKTVTIYGDKVTMGSWVFLDDNNLQTVNISSNVTFSKDTLRDCSLQTLNVKVVSDKNPNWNTECNLPAKAKIIVLPVSKLDLMRETWPEVADRLTSIYQLKVLSCDHAKILFLDLPDVIYADETIYANILTDPGYELVSLTYDDGEGEKTAVLLADYGYYQFNIGVPTVDVVNIKATVQKALSVVKSEAAIELKAWAGKNPSDDVTAILDQYLAKIDAAGTAAEVGKLLKAGKDEISTLQEVEAALKEAIRELKAWAGDAPSKAIAAVLKQYTAKLSASEIISGTSAEETVSEIEQLLQEGKDEISALQTLDEHKASAVRALELLAGDTPTSAVKKIVEQYTAKINAAATAAKVDQLLTAAEKAIRTKEKSTIQSVAMNKIQKTLYARKDGKQRDTLQLKVQVTPAKAEYGKITWKSSRPEVAKVNAKGLVTALKPGTTKITATIKEGDRKWTAACKIIVKKKDAKVTGISAKPKTLTLKKGQKGSIRLTFKPAGVYNNKVKWTTSDKKIATVSADGVITARKKGTCTVTATAADGSCMKVTIKVTVK